MKKRILAIMMAVCVVASFSACSFSDGVATVKDKMSGLLSKDSTENANTELSTNGKLFTVGTTGFSETEFKIVLISYQKSYAQVYGINLWEHEFGAADNPETYIKDLTLTKLAEIATYDEIGINKGIELTDSEKIVANEAAETFYAQMSESEKAYTGASKEEVYSVLEKQLLAEKVYSELTKNVNTEVSDSEARIMEAKLAEYSDPVLAASAITEMQNGADYTTAVTGADNVQILDVDRSMFNKDMTDIIFALDEGASSGVVNDQGHYYVVYCVMPFNEEKTLNNKEKVLEERMSKVVEETYDQYKEGLTSVLDDAAWSELHVDKALQYSEKTYRDVYSEYFSL